MALSEKGLSRLDPRQGGKAFQNTFDYRGHKKFTHLTTTTEGEIAIGSKEGDIRLYPNDQRGTATARYAGMGDPVLHL
jgi:hypothetical protein